MPTAAPPEPWNYPRNAHGLSALLAAASDRGVPTEVALAGTSLSSAAEVDPDSLVGADEELRVIRNIVAYLDGDDAGIGAAAGAQMTLGMLGVWGFAQLASPSLLEAGHVAVRYAFGRFSFVFSRPYIGRRPGVALTVFDPSVLPEDVRGCLLERDLAGSLAIARQLLGGEVRGVRVETTLDPARIRLLREAVAPAEVVPTSGANALVIPEAIAKPPLPLADPVALRRWVALCEEEAATRAGRIGPEPLAIRVSHAIRRHPATPPALAALSASWHLDERSIRRRLAAEGTSYTQIIDEVRRELATGLLERGLTVAETASRLGFAEGASFSRAFKRWTGVPPSRWRSD